MDRCYGGPMTHRLSGTLTILATAAVLTACSDAAEETQSVDQWLEDQHSEAEGPETLAMMSSRVQADTAPEPGHGVSVDFSTTATLSAAEFSCYGDGSMLVDVETGAPGGTQCAQMGPFDCTESPHSLNPDGWALESPEVISVNGHSSEEDSAWFFALEGSED